MPKNSTLKKDTNKRKSLKSLVKWAGGKAWFSDVIVSLFESNKKTRFIEPFAGGMSSAIAIKSEETLINDINPHLINFYKQVQNGLTVTLTMEYCKTRYYKYREMFNENIKKGEINTPEMAQLFFYLNKTGFNGMCRFNRSGFFNVPFGKYKTVNYHKDFLMYKALFEKWEFRCEDFVQIETTKDDFTFIDSPYDDSFADYSQDGFKWDDQVRTAEWAAKMEGPVVMTNKATDRIIELYDSLGFKVRVIKARRTISSKADERKPVWEVIAYKNIKTTSLFMERTEDYKDVLEGY